MPVSDTHEPNTVPLPTRGEPTRHQPGRLRGRWWRGLTGALTAGLCVLTLVVVGTAMFTPAPGPGPVSLIGHPVAAVVAVIAQVIADRRKGRAAGLAGLTVLLATATVLWFFWWE